MCNALGIKKILLVFVAKWLKWGYNFIYEYTVAENGVGFGICLPADGCIAQ